jgi:hypothetical protein
MVLFEDLIILVLDQLELIFEESEVVIVSGMFGSVVFDPLVALC